MVNKTIEIFTPRAINTETRTTFQSLSKKKTFVKVDSLFPEAFPNENVIVIHDDLFPPYQPTKRYTAPSAT